VALNPKECNWDEIYTRFSVSDIDYGGLRFFLRICSIRKSLSSTSKPYKQYFSLQTIFQKLRFFKLALDDVFFTLVLRLRLAKKGTLGKCFKLEIFK
jgi:hypothetical protein